MLNEGSLMWERRLRTLFIGWMGVLDEKSDGDGWENWSLQIHGRGQDI